MIKILQDTELVKDIFAEEFGSEPPPLDQGSVIAIVEGGQIKAFLLVEMLIRAGLLWVTPEQRKTPQAAKYIKDLSKYVIYTMAPGMSGITIDDTGRYGKIFEQIGMYPVEGQIYRKDF